LRSDRLDGDLARFLVEHGADPTAQDDDGWTPLHVLSGSDRPDADLVRFFVEYGTDATARTRSCQRE
jgi:ankyrin repeat protein